MNLNFTRNRIIERVTQVALNIVALIMMLLALVALIYKLKFLHHGSTRCIYLEIRHCSIHLKEVWREGATFHLLAIVYSF